VFETAIFLKFVEGVKMCGIFASCNLSQVKIVYVWS